LFETGETKGGEAIMPIYEFKCKTCEHIFEELVSMSVNGDSLTCSRCGAIGARKLISTFAAHGLENGHIAVGRKLTGVDAAAAASAASAKSESSKPESAKVESTQTDSTKAESSKPESPKAEAPKAEAVGAGATGGNAPA
jgi:putative FmdB family regulatory protein